MNRQTTLVLAGIFAFSAAAGQPRENAHFLLNLMKREPKKFQRFISHKDQLEIQIIYTQVNRDANNVPVFRTFYYNVDSNRYFYPASTVKLPMALMALEKIEQLHVAGLDKFAPMFSDSVYSGQKSVTRDTTSVTGLPSIAHYIKKMLVVSDNDGYNRLYEFMGQQAANENMALKGYHARFLHRLDRALSPDENRHTEAIRFVRNDTLIYRQDMLAGDSIPVRGEVLKGQGYYRNDTLIHQPFDFSYKNFFPLNAQQLVLRSIVFPNSVSPLKRFSVSEGNRRFVLKYMSQLPAETDFPPYGTDTTYYPAYAKFLMFGNDHDTIPPTLRIFNKIGDAYGYLIDNAYIVDFENQVEFFLAAVILANTDGIFNRGEYDYKDIGYPFMKELGRLLYNYELKRKRARKPDLNEFRFRYDIDFDKD